MFLTSIESLVIEFNHFGVFGSEDLFSGWSQGPVYIFFKGNWRAEPQSPEKR